MKEPNKRFRFHWETIDVMIGGQSIIDSKEGLKGYSIRTYEDADRFMQSYGFDLEDPIEQAEVEGHVQEAISFVRKYFLAPENPDGIQSEIPKKIVESRDIRDLILMASMSYPNQMYDPQGIALRNWACSILKIAHTIAHMDKDARYTYFSDIQKQILDRFYKFVHRTDGELFLGYSYDDPLKVPLVSFETKPRKSRESILLKLLHKTENVAESIFDEVGVRFVTKDRFTALRLVKSLKDMMLVMPANIKPSRSKNTLLDLESIREKGKEWFESWEQGEIPYEDLQSKVNELSEFDGSQNQNTFSNPHSSHSYRSLQFTSRQLIKLRNPLFDDIRELKQLSRQKSLGSDISQLIDRTDLRYIQREVRFFYPYEVQIVDQKAAEDNEKGDSSHEHYKRSQVQAAMKRVMGQLLHEQDG